MQKSMGFDGDCKTTAMGIMPHKDVEKALKLSFSLDIPFWPQLPNVSYFEDMYAQASEHFPGIIVDTENKRILFDPNKFDEQLIPYSEKMADTKFFSLSEDYSVVYHQFLNRDLKKYTAIRGQLIEPVSFGFKVMDEDIVPIIYNEQARVLLFDFLQPGPCYHLRIAQLTIYSEEDMYLPLLPFFQAYLVLQDFLQKPQFLSLFLYPLTLIAPPFIKINRHFEYKSI